MKVITKVFLLIFLVSCSEENLEKKIASTWKVEKMQRNVRGSFQNMAINPKMLFQFEETGNVKIVTHLGETIKGTWTCSENIKTIHIIANNESKDFVIDSINNKMLYLTSNDVKIHLKKSLEGE